MKNENMGVEELYLAPEDTKESDDVVLSDTSENELDAPSPIKVENTFNGSVVCDGVLADVAEMMFCETFSAGEETDLTLPYRITVTMDTSAGNAYQNAEIALGIRWSIVLPEGEEGATA